MYMYSLVVCCHRIIFLCKCKVKIFWLTWHGCILGSGTLSIHVLFVCIVIFIFPDSDIPRVGPVEAELEAELCWSQRCCQLLLLYFPKLWSAETGDLILILIGFFWIEMRVEILELPAKEKYRVFISMRLSLQYLLLSPIHKAAITKQESFILYQEELNEGRGFEK